MRTTIIIEDELFHRAKHAAADAGVSLSALVSEALRQSLAAATRPSPRRAFRMVVYGDPAQLTVTGVGGAAPLPKRAGESDRAHQSRLARVDVSVQMRR